MKKSLVILLALLVAVACKKDTTTPLQNLGNVTATFNGTSWPNKNTETNTRVYTQHSASYCPNNIKKEKSILIVVNTRAINNRLYAEGVSIAVNLANIAKTMALESEDPNNSDIYYICKLFDRGSAKASFSYTYNDGYDVQATTYYGINPTRVSTLTITKYDTVAKVVEGRFDAHFVKGRQFTNNSRPDTIQVRCSRFVAPFTN